MKLATVIERILYFRPGTEGCHRPKVTHLARGGAEGVGAFTQAQVMLRPVSFFPRERGSGGHVEQSTGEPAPYL